MSRLPTLDLYNEAVQHPQLAFTDQQLQAGKVRTNGLGLPFALGGGFAITYSLHTGNQTYAVRLFHKQAAGLEDRYRLISAELARQPSPYFVGFQYQPQGIRVQGQHYPLVKMEWVNGDTLGSFLDAHHGNRTAIEQLRRAFQELAKHLKMHGIAHGDLQTGNVIVDRGQVRLIDYDGMFVPGMRAGNGSELGHRHFQHPGRSPSDFGGTMDRFSFIVLDISLAALAAEPRLFAKYATTGENILFTGNDFKDPRSSRVFADLRAMPSLRKHADDLAAICQAAISSVPEIDEFLAGQNIPAIVATVTITPSTQRPAYAGSLPVIDALDFTRAAQHIGDRVELIGCITDVKYDLTRRSKHEYVFINFGHWRGQIVKINIWHTGLAKLRQRPDPSWVGRWVSVTGLMDPPYTSNRFGYTHLSVTVEEPSQMHLIDADEAAYRLGRSGSQQLPPRNNQKILETIRHGGIEQASSITKPIKQKRRRGRGINPPVPTSTPTPQSRNQAILRQIQTTSVSGSAPAQHARASGTAARQRVAGTPKQRDKGGCGCLAVIAIVVLLLLIARCAT